MGRGIIKLYIMIKKKKIKGTNLIYTYSTRNKKIKQLETGFIFDEAYDVLDYGYEETEIDREILED